MIFYIKYRVIYIKAEAEGSGGNNNNNSDNGNSKGGPFLGPGGKCVRIK